MIIKFYKFNEGFTGKLLKESKLDNCVLPHSGCTVVIDKEQYKVDHVHIDYDNGLIAVDLI